MNFGSFEIVKLSSEVLIFLSEPITTAMLEFLKENGKIFKSSFTLCSVFSEKMWQLSNFKVFQGSLNFCASSGSIIVMKKG